MSGAPVRSPLSPAVRGRCKRAVRTAVEHCGNISGAAATCERKDQSVGEWHATATQSFPPVDCAMAMDEVALANGQRAEILHRYAAELRHVAIPLPEGAAAADAEALALMEAAAEFGDVAGAVRDMLADGLRERHERDRVTARIDDLLPVLVRLRAIVADDGPIAVPLRSAEP